MRLRSRLVAFVCVRGFSSQRRFFPFLLVPRSLSLPFLAIHPASVEKRDDSWMREERIEERDCQSAVGPSLTGPDGNCSRSSEGGGRTSIPVADGAARTKCYGDWSTGRRRP